MMREDPSILTPDLCVIGAGAAGLSVAAGAAAFGAPVVLIEKGEMGGECLNSGCVPSKALIASAERASAWQRDRMFGIASPQPIVDFRQVHDHVQAVIAAIAPNDSAERFIGLGVNVIRAQASFADARTVNADGRTIRARRFVIATGSRPTIPPIPGLAETPYLTNETVFGLAECPGHLAIIGGGPIGIELAQAFRRLGAQVSVIEAGQSLAKDDTECAALVLQTLREEGILILEQAKVASVSGRAGEIRIAVTVQGAARTIEATHLLIATGRTPTIDGLGLDAAGIAHTAKGIRVDHGLRTSNRRVYAIGDVTGMMQFTHVAGDHAALVLRNALFRLPLDTRRRLIPHVTYTHPELAHVGMSEAQARAEGRTIRILRSPFHDNDRAQTERRTGGHIKIVTTIRGRILGATIVGDQAGELIAMWTLAVTQKLNIRAIAGLVLPYPTRSEIGKRAAVSFFASSLTGVFVKRIIAFLRLFG